MIYDRRCGVEQHGCIPLDGNVAHKLVADEVLVRKGNVVARKRACKYHWVCDICVTVCERRAVGGEKVSVVMWRDAGVDEVSTSRGAEYS